MAPANPQNSKYSTLSGVPNLSLDTDLEDQGNDSDTTLASSSFLKSRPSRSSSPKSRLQKREEFNSRKESMFVWIRWGVVIFFQCVIIVLLIPGTGLMGGTKWDESMTETGGDVNGLYIPSTDYFLISHPLFLTPS